MNNKDNFKLFVKDHPELIDYVKDDRMTWQKFYEIYNIYGNDNKAWAPYFNDNSKKSNEDALAPVKEVMNYISKIEPAKLQNGISSLQKGLTLFQELFFKDKGTKNIVKPVERAIYKRFED